MVCALNVHTEWCPAAAEGSDVAGERWKAESLVYSDCWSPFPTQPFYSFVIFKAPSNPAHPMILSSLRTHPTHPVVVGSLRSCATPADSLK